MKLRDLISESVFRNWTKIVGEVDFKRFVKNYKKLDKTNVVAGSNGEYYGFKKGSKEAEWKYIEDESKLYSDMNDTEVHQIKGR